MNFLIKKTGFIVIGLLGICAADQPATTADGKKVVLLDNFTWRYVPQNQTSDINNQNNHQMLNGSTIQNGPAVQNDPAALNGSAVKNVPADIPAPDDSKKTSLVDIVKNDASFDFRKVRWGMNSSQVKASENSKLNKSSIDSLVYSLSFFGYDCSVIYRFSKDRLVRASLLIEQPHADPELYYKDYDNLKNYLSPIYQNMISDNCDWKNEMYRSDRSKWGFAVSLGFLSCQTQWKNSRTTISLNISGGNHQISTGLEYTGN